VFSFTKGDNNLHNTATLFRPNSIQLRVLSALHKHQAKPNSTQVMKVVTLKNESTLLLAESPANSETEIRDEAVAVAVAPSSKNSQSSNSSPVSNSANPKKETDDDGEGDAEKKDVTAKVFASQVLKPSPYFYYTDHSLEVDDNPNELNTTCGRVPTFPISE
jgi:hypothetical protein